MNVDNPKRKRLLKSLSILIGIGTALLLIFLIDGVSYFILKIEKKPTYPIIFDGSANIIPEKISPLMPAGEYNYYDPHLGYAHNPYKALDQALTPGFAFYGTSNPSQGVNALKIVILDGSMTDGNQTDNWAKVLYETMISQGYQVQILNGSVAGYSSNQELVKMIRDVIPLQPDLILSFSGLNDVGFYGALDKHPMVNTFQASLMQHLTEKRSALLPNTFSLIASSLENLDKQRRRGVIYGPDVSTTPVKQWERNNRLMAAISKEFKIPYLSFLEPGLGVGKYELSIAEQETYSSLTKEIDPNYAQSLEEFYRDARSSCQRSDVCVDFVDIFAGQKNIYTDKMTISSLGHQIIADAVLKTLKSRFGDDLSKVNSISIK